MTQLSPLNAPFFPALTGVRALAAWMVFVHHFALIPEYGEFTFWQHFIYELHIGVTVFFVLSGFLITLRYYEGFSAGKISFRQYFFNRFARVYPMYFLITVATFAAGYFGMQRKEPPGFFDGQNLMLHLTFLRGFFGELWFTGVTQGWTLTVEECFYLSAPLIFFLARKGSFRLWIQPVLLLAAGFALVLVFRHITWHGFFAGNRFMLLRTYFGRCVEFFVGIQLGLIYLRRQREGKIQNRTSGFGWFTYGGIAWIVACLCGFVMIKEGYEQGLYHPAGIVINNAVLPVGIALVFWGLVTEKTLLSQVLSTGLFQLLGKSSYTFYLIHFGILSACLQWYVTANPWLIFLVMVGLSVILFYLLEEPLNKLVRKWGLPSGKKQAG